MCDGIFGGMFDLDSDGELDCIESAMEMMFIEELLSEEEEEEE